MSDKIYFNRLNYTKQDIPSKPFTNLTCTGITNNIEFLQIDKFLKTAPKEQIEKIFDFTKTRREQNCGLGEAYIDEVKTKYNSGVYIHIKKSGQSTKPANILINFTLDGKNNVLYDMNFIHIEEGQKAKIFIYIDVDNYNCKSIDLFRNGLLSILVEKNAELELIKVQNISHCGINFESMKMQVLSNAKVQFYDLQLGAKINGSSVATYLPEQFAEVQIYPLYFADKNRRIDLEQNLIINGEDSLASVLARGALKNTANKMFRGNIFLNKGCHRSTARFADTTIMLDKTTHGATIPTIFCDEDDVIGEHAASFEAVNRDKLYYLMTRGFDELSAKKLIIEAAFKPVFNMIDDEAIREKLIDEFRTNLNEIS